MGALCSSSTSLFTRVCKTGMDGRREIQSASSFKLTLQVVVDRTKTGTWNSKLMDTEAIRHRLHRKAWWIPLKWSLYLQLSFWQAHGSFKYQVAPVRSSERYLSHLPLASNAVNIWVNKEYGTVKLIATATVSTQSSDSSLCSVNYTFPLTMNGNGLSTAPVQLKTLTKQLTHFFSTC